MLYCLIEGEIDETFFRHILGAENVNYYQYAKRALQKVNGFINSLNHQKENYLFFVDADGDSISNKKNKIMSKYPTLNPEKIFVVQYEIESWIIAGVDNKFCQKYKITYLKNNTNKVTKEMFRQYTEPMKNTKLNIILTILNSFNCLLASQRNQSFSIFYNKHPQICK